MEYRICRLCESEDSTNHMLYIARSYAHLECRLKRMSLEDGLAWLRSLSAHDIRNAPPLVVQNWLNALGWTGDRALELLLGMANEADKRSVER
jgi:hypothetical protein